MLRISAGVSLCFTLLAVGGGLGACSSDSTDGGKAGSGNTAGSGGSSSGGTGSGRSGSSTVGECTPGVVTCVDENTAQTCDADTGLPTTINCVDDLKEIGITSTGCAGDETDGSCDGDFIDTECLDGATVFAICGQYTQDEFLNVYINCFQNNDDVQEPIRCVGPYLAASGNQADCDAAAIDCLGAEAGGAGAGGASGGGTTGEAGAPAAGGVASDGSGGAGG